MKFFIGIQVVPMKNGRWKAYLWGRHQRYASIEGQVRVGFDSADAASSWVRGRFASKHEASALARTVGGGTRLDDALIERGKLVALPERNGDTVLVGTTIELRVCGVVLRGIRCPACKASIDQCFLLGQLSANTKSVTAFCPHCERDCRVDFAMTATVVSVTTIAADKLPKGRRP